MKKKISLLFLISSIAIIAFLFIRKNYKKLYYSYPRYDDLTYRGRMWYTKIPRKTNTRTSNDEILRLIEEYDKTLNQNSRRKVVCGGNDIEGQ